MQSKEEVLVLVFRDEMDRVCEQAFASIREHASLLDACVHVFGALVAFHDSDQGLARVFVKEVLFVKEQHQRGIYDFVEALIARCADLVEQAKNTGRGRRRRAGAAAGGELFRRLPRAAAEMAGSARAAGDRRARRRGCATRLRCSSEGSDRIEPHHLREHGARIRRRAGART